MENEKLCSKGSTFEEAYAGAFGYDIELNARRRDRNYICVRLCKNVRRMRNRGEKFANAAEFARQLRLQKEKIGQSIGVFLADSPDKYVNSVANIWLKRQLSLGKDWGRLYGRGFRDVMQDTSAFCSLVLRLRENVFPKY